MIVFISGPMRGFENYKRNFEKAEKRLNKLGVETIFNPAYLPESENISHEQYMAICYKMLDCCDTIYLLNGWAESEGACSEEAYGSMLGYNFLKEEYTDENLRREIEIIRSREEGD